MLTAEEGDRLFTRVQNLANSQESRRSQLVALRTMLEGILLKELGSDKVYHVDTHQQILMFSCQQQHFGNRPEMPPGNVKKAMHKVRKLGNKIHEKAANPLDTPPEPNNDDYYDAFTAICDVIAYLSQQKPPILLQDFLNWRALPAPKSAPGAISAAPTVAAAPVVATSVALAPAPVAAVPQPVAPVAETPRVERVVADAGPALPEELPFLRLFVRKVKQDVKATPQGVTKRYTLLGMSDEYDAVEVVLTEPFGEVGALAWAYSTVHLFNVRKVPETTDRLTTTPTSLVVLEPDYLVNASDIAEAMTTNNAEDVNAQHVSALLAPGATSEAMLLGIIVNNCFDELIANPNLEPEAVFQRALRQDQRNALSALALGLSTETLREKAREHIVTLRGVVHEALQHGADFTVEPSFLSDRYGIQGRMDVLLQYVSDPNRIDILELKSGKAPRAQSSGNGWSVWPAHGAQALGYALLTEEPFPQRVGSNSIVYSADRFDPVRPATDSLRQRQSLLAARNRLVALLYRLQKGHVVLASLAVISPASMLPPFTKEHINALARRVGGLAPLELAYYTRMTQFIAREQWLAKVGVNPEHGLMGMAGLWRTEIGEKRERFDIMSGLTPIVSSDGALDPELRLTRDPQAQETVNFREGDIALLYPLEADGASQPTHHQLLTCTVREVTRDVVTVRLSNRRVSQDYLAQQTTRGWALEHNILDSSFDRMYHSLTLFMEGRKDARDLMLGQRLPTFGPLPDAVPSADLTARQHDLIQRALSARDCFLIQGPPGAGKTSRVIREMTRRLVAKPNESVLLLAYTNRAVDELCDAIADIAPAVEFIRLGAPSSTKREHQPRTLAGGAQEGSSLAEMGQRIGKARVVISTALAFLGYPDLLKLKTFTTAIVDEASQLLDAHLVGPLSQVQRFILIGDHYQLPAVVAQSPQDSLLSADVPAEAALRQSGINDLRMSLFERLWNQFGQSEAGRQARGQLTEQGRMHETIQGFPNTRFYANQLCTLQPRQQAPLAVAPAALAVLLPSMRAVAEALAEDRLIVIPTSGFALRDGARARSDLTEASRVAALVRVLQALHPRREGQTSNADDEQIGVITPWRAQVAAIRAALDRVELRGASPLVDTVERYQGSERDVIIISLATNDAGYLQGMTDLWRGAADAEQVEHSVDRKLNVALTRAREQIILLGRLEVVGAADGGHYGALFEYVSEHGRYFSEDECAALDRLAQPILAPTAQTTPQSA